MYAIIDQHPSVFELYTRRLRACGVLHVGEAAAIKKQAETCVLRKSAFFVYAALKLVSRYMGEKYALSALEPGVNVGLMDAGNKVHAYQVTIDVRRSSEATLKECTSVQVPVDERRISQRWDWFAEGEQNSKACCSTGVPRSMLRAIGRVLSKLPWTGFDLHPKVAELMAQRSASIQDGRGIMWGTAEVSATERGQRKAKHCSRIVFDRRWPSVLCSWRAITCALAVKMWSAVSLGTDRRR